MNNKRKNKYYKYLWYAKGDKNILVILGTGGIFVP